ncbi:hypothetical protein CK203_095139 [Vitis vinifera]|uniref:Uncharacterized protein n=1 Tax=Vitis vinifera TaxID=29760 RepID=A0A438C7B4_VITVI|nr:hypothetical protein CK203_095139 [Vitis vinifera]
MDIDLLWALGGWFLVPDCMAAFRTTTISETSTKSHPFLLFLALLFILLILVHPAHQSRPSAMDSSNITPSQRLLLSSDSSPTSTVNLHPKQTHASSSPSSSHPRRLLVESLKPVLMKSPAAQIRYRTGKPEAAKLICSGTVSCEAVEDDDRECNRVIYCTICHLYGHYLIIHH